MRIFYSYRQRAYMRLQIFPDIKKIIRKLDNTPDQVPAIFSASELS